MKRLILITRAAAAFFAMVLWILACSLPLPESGQQPEGGLITLVFSQTASRNLLPDIELVVDEYVVSGIGPYNHSFSTAVSSNSLQLDLAAGEWLLSVTGVSADGTEVAQAIEQADIQPDAHTTVQMTLQLLAGEGSLDVVIDWPENTIQHPSVFAELEPLNGDEIIDLDFTVQSQQAVFSGDSIPSGYYFLECRVYDGDNFVFTTGVTAVLIVSDGSTTGSFSFTPYYQSGSMEITIDDVMLDVITLSIDASSFEKHENAILQVDGVVSNEAYISDGAIWEWFLDGRSIGNESSLLLDESILEGQYQLDVVIRDGLRAASAGELLTVLPPLEALIIEGFVVDPWYAVNGQFEGIDLSASISEHGGAVVESVGVTSPHAANTLLSITDGTYTGETTLDLDEPGSYRFEAYVESASGEYSDSASASLYVLPVAASAPHAFSGAGLQYPDADLGLPDHAVLVAEPSVNETGSLRYQHELDGSGTTVTVPLFERNFGPLEDYTRLTFWFKGRVSGNNPALRLQVAGGGSVSNYYDLNGITTERVYHAGQATNGGSFPVEEIDVEDWTRVILDLSNVDWTANGGGAAEDYVLTARIRTGSSHDWFIDDIRFEP